MIRVPVQSSMFKSLGHEGDVLEVEFNNGRIGRHPGVSADQYAALLNAESAGRHYNQNIKGKFDFVQGSTEDDEAAS